MWAAVIYNLRVVIAYVQGNSGVSYGVDYLANLPNGLQRRFSIVSAIVLRVINAYVQGQSGLLDTFSME